MRHIISLLIENESGALSRVAGLYSARGYNIESLTVAPTDDPSLSRMTIVTFGSDTVVEQIAKQTDKLIDVVRSLSATLEEELLDSQHHGTNQDHQYYRRRQTSSSPRIPAPNAALTSLTPIAAAM